MKKILSVVLVLVLVLSMSLVAFAEWGPVRIDKNLLLTNAGTISPAETFNFTVGNGQVMEGNAGSAPAFPSGTFSINLGQGQLEGFTDIQLPEYEHVGVYLYEVNEMAGNTAGMDYSSDTYFLEVTVLNAEDGDGLVRFLTMGADGIHVKTDAFVNEFSAGSLVVNKIITGNYAVFEDEFEVTVELTPDEGKDIKEGPITVSGAVNDSGSVSKNEDGIVSITFLVTHESEVTIANIPYGVSYVVSEDSGDYEQAIVGGQGTIGNALQEVEITNTLNTEIQTGINLDNLPYILILGAATVGLFGFTMKKKFNK